MQQLLHLSRRVRMKNLRQLCAALVLTLAFALSAYADDGHVPCGVTSLAPDTVETLDGHVPCGFAESLISSLLSLV
jgi:hypothetical protein